MIVSREPILDLRVFLNPDRGLPYPFNERPTHFYAYGRVALLAGLKLLRLKEGDNVLIPSYICNVVMAPFNYLKIGVKFFEVSLNPGWTRFRILLMSGPGPFWQLIILGFPLCCLKLELFASRRNCFSLRTTLTVFLAALEILLWGPLAISGFSASARPLACRTAPPLFLIVIIYPLTMA